VQTIEGTELNNSAAPVTAEPSAGSPIAPTSDPEASKPSESPKTNDLSHQFAILSKKEKAFREMQKALKEREEAVAQRAKELEEFDKDPYGYHQKKDPKAYEKWTERILNNGKPGLEESVSKLEQQFQEKYAKRIDELETKVRTYEESLQKKEIDQYVDGIRAQVKQDKYEFIREQGEDGVAAVYHTIVQHAQATQKLMSYEEACDIVEDALFEEAKKFTKLNKLKEVMAPQESPKTIPEGHKDTRPTTLTNTMASQAATREQRVLTKEQSLAEAAKLIKFV
jgi:hypothetical protein